MIPALARFVAVLRDDGLSVSPAEIVDASRALDLVGPDSRAAVRAALRATLAKDHESARIFDRAFDRYFVPPERTGRGTGKGRPGGAGETPRKGALPRPGAGKAAAKPPEREDRRGRPGNAPRRSAERASARERDEAGPPRAGRDVERGPARSPRVVRARHGADRPGDPRRADLARRMTTEDERRIAREVAAMVGELRVAKGRRHERARTGRPWLRRAVRENLSRGGVPFVIPYRARRKSRVRVTLLVDVSFSTARAAGMFLLMARAFLALGRRTRVLAFVDRPVDATAAVARWTEGRWRPEPAPPGPRPPSRHRQARPGLGIVLKGVAFADVLDGLAGLNLDAPSDYGRTFHALLASRRRPRGRDAVLVVLGDGRTNRFDPLPWALRDLARGCRFVLWLAAEPAARWGTADSALPAYLESVDLVAEATDLEGLARGLAALVRRL